MKRTTWIAVGLGAVVATASRAWASPESDVAKARAEGRAVFLIVTEGNASGMDLARRVTAAARQIVPETDVVEMDRADPANAALVERYRLESVPVPLILVVASNGAAAGGARPHLVTASRLARMIPSPAKAAHRKALDEKKASFLVFARESMPARADALRAAADAVTALAGAAVVTPVDLDAAKEAGFVAEMQVAPTSTGPLVVVFNAKGQRTATLAGVPAANDLVEAAKREIQECCPGGRCK